MTGGGAVQHLVVDSPANVAWFHGVSFSTSPGEGALCHDDHQERLVDGIGHRFSSRAEDVSMRGVCHGSPASLRVHHGSPSQRRLPDLSRPSSLAMAAPLALGTLRGGSRHQHPGATPDSIAGMGATGTDSATVQSPSLCLSFPTREDLHHSGQHHHDHHSLVHDDSPHGTHAGSAEHLALLHGVPDDTDDHHQNLDDLHLSFNHLSDPPSTDHLFPHHRLDSENLFAAEAIQEQQQSDDVRSKRKGQWTDARIAELRELVAKYGQSTPNHRQSTNFWSDLTESSRTLKVFTKEAVRMKARRLGLFTEDILPKNITGFNTSASRCSASTGTGKGPCAKEFGATDAVPNVPGPLRHDIFLALMERGLSNRQVQRLSKKHGQSPEALEQAVTTLLNDLCNARPSDIPRPLARSPPMARDNTAIDAETTEIVTPESSAMKMEWTPERVAELKRLMAHADELHFRSTGNANQRPSFWRDLANSSQTLRGFSREALRMKAKRLNLGVSDTGDSPENFQDAIDNAAMGTPRGRWTDAQMLELQQLLENRKHLHGSAVVHERGFWISLRNESQTLKGYSNESLRMKARRMRLLDSASNGFDFDLQAATPSTSAMTHEAEPQGTRRGWSGECTEELCQLLAARQEAGISQSRNGFWEDLIRESRTLHAFKPDSVRKKVKAMEEKGLLPVRPPKSRAPSENRKSQRQMPLNPAQVKELQLLTKARMDTDASMDSPAFWEELKEASRTLKNCSVEVMQSRAKRLKLQGAFEKGPGELNSDMEAVTDDIPVCFPMASHTDALHLPDDAMDPEALDMAVSG